MPGIRRILEIVVTDGLGLDNSIARLRALTSAAVAAINLLEVGELEERISALEAVVGHPDGSPERCARRLDLVLREVRWIRAHQ